MKVATNLDFQSTSKIINLSQLSVNLSASQPGLIFNAASNQTANIWEVKNSSGDIVSYYNPFLSTGSTFLKFQGPAWSLSVPYLSGTLMDISAGSQNIFKLYKASGAGDESILQLTSATGTQYFQFVIGAGSVSMNRNGSNFLQSGGNGTVMFPVNIEAGSTTQTTLASGFFTARADNLRAIIGKRFSVSSTQNIFESQDENGNALSVLAKFDGSYQPASLTDSSTTNNSVYFSSTTSQFTFKNSGGALNSFSGINTGDQSSIVGITGTASQFNTALTDGDFATLAGIETLTNKVIVRKSSTKTSSYTLSNADDYVRFNGTSLIATLPDAIALSGYQFKIKNVNTSVLRVNTTSSQLMDSNLIIYLSQYEVLDVISNGVNWDII
jgi:hypothetical protein